MVTTIDIRPNTPKVSLRLSRTLILFDRHFTISYYLTMMPWYWKYWALVVQLNRATTPSPSISIHTFRKYNKNGSQSRSRHRNIEILCSPGVLCRYFRRPPVPRPNVFPMLKFYSLDDTSLEKYSHRQLADEAFLESNGFMVPYCKLERCVCVYAITSFKPSHKIV